MKKIIFAFVGLLVVAVLYFGFATDVFHSKEATDFASCVALGNPVMESYPRQCRDAGGRSFTEDLGLSNLIRVTTPASNAQLERTVQIRGEARGTWFFEASFPVILETASGKVIAQGHATTSSDWMTEQFIPFSTRLSFSVATNTPGFVVLKKDNPSGNRELERELRIPVVFLRSDILEK